MLTGALTASYSGPPLRLTDGLMEAISDRLAAVIPERGGAILAAGGLLYLLIEDTSGRYTESSWDISDQLTKVVGEVESAGHGTVAGTVHTHPPGFPDPSSADIATTREALGLNPHLAGLVIAVVSEGTPRERDLPMGARHRMSLHLLRRDAPTPLGRMQGEVVPLAGDLAAAGIKISSVTSVTSWRRGRRTKGTRLRSAVPTVVNVNHSPRLSVRVPGATVGMLFIDPGYPHVGPIAVAAVEGGGDVATLKPLPSPWDPVAPSKPQLIALARGAVGRRLLGSTRRVRPLVGVLANHQVLVAGAGSVGSRIAEDLVRSGVGAMTVIDPDYVDASNLARSVYCAADIGVPKPEALARRLQAIEPAIAVDGHASPVGATELAQVLTGISLVVSATDDMAEQALLAHHAYFAGVPLVACALYRKAAAGEVVLSVPSADTACWACAVGAGTMADTYRPQRDYGLAGRLASESALGPSIHLVAGVAASAALGLLAGPTSKAGEAVGQLLARRRSLGLVAASPQWSFFKRVFADMDHQFAPQSVWVRVARSPDCPVCGAMPVPPLGPRAATDLTEITSRYLKRTLRVGETIPRSDQERLPNRP
jgi:molybdopterin/thiamine biosynthesis adenylyltransferase